MSDYEDYESTLAATDCDGSELETRPFKRKCVSVGGKAPRTVVGSLGSNSDRPKVTFIGSRANFSGCGRDVWMRATSVLRGRHRGDNEGRRQLSQICMEQRGKWLEAFKQTNVDVVDEKLGNGFKVKGVCIDTDGTLLVLVHNVSLLAMAKALDDVDFHNYWS